MSDIEAARRYERQLDEYEHGLDVEPGWPYGQAPIEPANYWNRDVQSWLAAEHELRIAADEREARPAVEVLMSLIKKLGGEAYE